jgi:hypothetical protein
MGVAHGVYRMKAYLVGIAAATALFGIATAHGVW